MTEAPQLTVLLDQNVPRPVASWLRGKRPTWDVLHACEVGLGGRPDREVFAWAQEKRALVITYDEDFADARFLGFGPHHGIVRLRVWPTTVERTVEALERALAAVSDDELAGALVIVGNRSVRIRPRRP